MFDNFDILYAWWICQKCRKVRLFTLSLSKWWILTSNLHFARIPNRYTHQTIDSCVLFGIKKKVVMGTNTVGSLIGIMLRERESCAPYQPLVLSPYTDKVFWPIWPGVRGPIMTITIDFTHHPWPPHPSVETNNDLDLGKNLCLRLYHFYGPYGTVTKSTKENNFWWYHNLSMEFVV